jgi:hypothetical protein
MHTGGRRSAIGHLGACALADGCAQVSRRTAGSHPAAMHLQMVARKSAGSHTSTFALHVGAQMSGGTTGSHLVDSHEQMGVHSVSGWTTCSQPATCAYGCRLASNARGPAAVTPLQCMVRRVHTVEWGTTRFSTPQPSGTQLSPAQALALTGAQACVDSCARVKND